MSKEYSYNTPLADILAPDGKNVNQTNLEIILKEEILVFCKNKKAQRFRIMPFKTLYYANSNFWHQDQNWEFYFTKEMLDKLKEKNIVEPAVSKSADTEETEDNNSDNSDFLKGFGDDYKVIAVMTNAEKVKYLNDIKHKMDNLISQKTKDKSAVTNVIVNTTRDAVMINHSALKNAFDLGDAEAKKSTQTLVFTTQEMVKSYVQLVSHDILDDDLMARLVKKSNGTIVQHMTRVYLNGIAFLVVLQQTCFQFQRNSKITDKFCRQIPQTLSFSASAY